jgi:hypothetical protein
MTTVEVSHAVENDVYDPDDVGLRDSPLLKPLNPKLQPTPSPPPDDSESDVDAKPVPSQGDAVLIGLLGGGKALEVARTAATQLLAGGDEMSDGSDKGVEVSAATMGKTGHPFDLAALAAGALNAVDAGKFNSSDATTASAGPTEPHVEEVNPGASLNGHELTTTADGLPVLRTEQSEDGNRHMLPSVFTTQGGEALAPIKEPSPKSEKANGFTLPSFKQLRHLTQLAEVATATADIDPNSAHRPQSPQSPPGPPLFQVGPVPHPGVQTSPPISPNDTFRRELPSPGRAAVSAPSPYYYNNPRRPSLATEGPPYPGATPHDYSSSATETPSTDQSGLTPACIPSGIDRMSIDGITNPQIGGFVCTYPGCTAQAFQTQYLLNSHANVHSSNRPHYCPVKGCPRGEGGKGFKRKNEMIRHGLVHESPGYVCPYCVDREHKYPRPDNLQRSVFDSILEISLQKVPQQTG